MWNLKHIHERERERVREGEIKEGTEEGPIPEELNQAVVVVPTPPDTGEIHFGPFSDVKVTVVL